MSIKKVIYYLLFVAFFVSCSDSYVGIDYKDDTKDTLNYETIYDKVPIMMSLNNPYYISTNRGVGAIDPDREWVWNNLTFYVYSFLANNYAYNGAIDYRATYNPLIEEDRNNPWQCLVDDPETGLGAPTKINYDETLDFVDRDAAYYYSQTNQEHKYNFFAYTIDDAQILNDRAVREKERIYLDIKIDGTQDVICSVARPTQSQLESLDPTANKWFATNVLNGELLYSTTTGHRSIFPVFDAKHCLSRFVFNLVGEDAMSDKIYVEDIYVKAHRDWRLTVAANDTSRLGMTMIPGVTEELEEIHLCEIPEDGETVDGSQTGLTPLKHSVGKNEIINNFGLGLLLPPREQYDLYIACAFQSTDGKIRRYLARYDLKNRTVLPDGTNKYYPFVAGSEYQVTIHIYGYQPIKLSMDGLDWGEPEFIPIDDENVEYDEFK